MHSELNFSKRTLVKVFAIFQNVLLCLGWVAYIVEINSADYKISMINVANVIAGRIGVTRV